MKKIFPFFATILFLISFKAGSQTVYFFRDGNNPGFYDSGLAFRTAPSLLEQAGAPG